jgi:soluble epoxide hydrolase / lipid-phosphate phosphatase
MDGLRKISLEVRAGISYTYWIAQPKDQKPTLLLFHGCPDSATLWQDLIAKHLLPAGYGVVAPDLLGYGSSSKPTGVENYTMSAIAADVVKILENEHLDKVIVLGHDFGAFLASRMCSYHPNKVSGLVTLGTAYIPPSPYPFNFEQIRAMQEQWQGYCSMWYFPLFTSETGYQLLDEQVENMFTALHGGGDRMKGICCFEGAMEKWLKQPANKDQPVLPYANSSNFRADWVDRLGRDGFRAPLDWYKAVVQSLDLELEKKVLEDGDHVVKAPYLFIAALNDPLSPKDAVQGPISQGMLPDVTLREVNGSHWCMLEKPQETGQLLVAWLHEKF